MTTPKVVTLARNLVREHGNREQLRENLQLVSRLFQLQASAYYTAEDKLAEALGVSANSSTLLTVALAIIEVHTTAITDTDGDEFQLAA
jgi:hypothetical protein